MDEEERISGIDQTDHTMGRRKTITQPYYYKGERGNTPYELDLMLYLHILQNLFDLSDESTAAEVIDSRVFSDFCGVESSNQEPDGDTIGWFRNILVKNGLQEKLFAQVLALSAERGLILKKGTIVDFTIIAAPSSTKNRERSKTRMHTLSKKSSTWHFGYKAHLSVDQDTGLVHHIKVTSANIHGVIILPQLLTGEETVVYRDSGYLGAEKREDAVIRNTLSRKIRYKESLIKGRESQTYSYN